MTYISDSNTYTAIVIIRLISKSLMMNLTDHHANIYFFTIEKKQKSLSFIFISDTVDLNINTSHSAASSKIS